MACESARASAQVSRRAACQYMLRQLEPLVAQVRACQARHALTRYPVACSGAGWVFIPGGENSA